MKSTHDFRSKPGVYDAEDLLKKAKKLDPIKKNGKEKRSFYDEEEEVDEDLTVLKKRESILDYFDDGEEE